MSKNAILAEQCEESYNKIDIIDTVDIIQAMKSDLFNLSRLTRDMAGHIFGDNPDVNRAYWLCNFLAEQFEAQSDIADLLIGNIVCMGRGAR